MKKMIRKIKSGIKSTMREMTKSETERYLERSVDLVDLEYRIKNLKTKSANFSFNR